MDRNASRRTVCLAAICLVVPAFAAASSGLHTNPIAPVIFGATTILFFALLGRFAARALGQPPVVGELIMGVAMGNLAGVFGYELILVLREGPSLFNMIDLSFHGHPLEQAAHLALGANASSAALDILRGPKGAEILQVAHVVDVFARYGALFLLFYVGLETTLAELTEVGAESTRVAVAGVIAPFLLGIAVVWLLLPELPIDTRLFIAATLSATSVGITASVLDDLGQQHSHEARVILGAAVIDDILGLILLAVIGGIVISGSVALGDIAGIVIRALGFLVGVTVLGPIVLRLYIGLAGGLPLVEAKLFVAIVFAMGVAWTADLMGLAPIVGAFAAGVVLSDGYFRHWPQKERRHYRVRELIRPLELVLVPFFFVLMGIQVKLESFVDWPVIRMSLGLLVAAIAGKLLSGLLAGQTSSRWVIGIGMLPRGEVGLVFAAIGKGLGVINDAIFSAVVLVVLVTTLAAPILLKRAFGPNLTATRSSH